MAVLEGGLSSVAGNEEEELQDRLKRRRAMKTKKVPLKIYRQALDDKDDQSLDDPEGLFRNPALDDTKGADNRLCFVFQGDDEVVSLRPAGHSDICVGGVGSVMSVGVIDGAVLPAFVLHLEIDLEELPCVPAKSIGTLVHVGHGEALDEAAFRAGQDAAALLWVFCKSVGNDFVGEFFGELEQGGLRQDCAVGYRLRV